VPFRLIATATRLPRSAASFWLDALLVPALSSRHQRDAVRHFQPTDATQSVSLPLCTRALVARPICRSCLRFARETRLFTQASLLRRDRVIVSSRCSLDAVIAIFASDLSVVIPLRALRPRSRTCAGLNHLRPFPPARRDANADLFGQEMPSVGVDSSAASFRKKPRPSRRRLVSNLGHLEDYASSV
jgi:hypothetical protein